MDTERKTRTPKKDRTGLYISIAVHIAVFAVIAYFLIFTEAGRQLTQYMIGAIRDKKAPPVKAPTPPTERRTVRPSRTDAPPPATGGGRRQVAAPAAVGEGMVIDERSKTTRTEKGSGAKTNVQQRAVPPPLPKIVLRPSVFTAPKTDIKQLLAERAKASALIESFGTEQISKSGASDVSDIVGRISGASLAEGKFAVVRGLADRYTLTTLNGADIPSADPNRRAVQLDLFPAQFISKVDVSKTFQPDMPGGFAGGALNIVTRTFPEKPLYSFGFGTSYNPQANMRNDYLVTDHGSRDWLAMDDGGRALPGKAAATSPRGDAGELSDEVKDSFHSRQFSPAVGDSIVNSGMAAAFGDTTYLFGKRLGLIAGVNYKNEYNFYDDGMVAKHIAPHPDSSLPAQSWTKSDARSVIEYTWGSIASLAYELNENHQLGFNFVYVQTAEDEARRLRGRDSNLTSPDADEDSNYLEQDILHWTERNLTYYQIQGKHDFPPLLDLHLDWVASLASTSQDEPDHRIVQFLASPGDPNDPTDDSYGAGGPTKPRLPTRIFREVEEDNKNFRVDLTLPVSSYNSQENSIKSGFLISASEQTLFTRAFEYNPRGNHPFNTSGDPNSLLDPANNAYVRLNNFPANYEYLGKQTIDAWYGMGTWSATEWLRFVGGMRFESTDLSVDTVNLSQGEQSRKFSQIQQDDILPAFTANILLRSNLQFRAAWSETVVRPTYREISEAEIYDVALGRTIRGNPDLMMSASQNFDARLEWYPRPGELISFGAFMKKISDAIEQAAQTTDNESIFFDNYKEADVFGVEVELRKEFRGFLGPGADLFSVGVNYAYIKSLVDLTTNQYNNRLSFGSTDRDRPMYDQPEFVVNGDLTWDNFLTGTSITLNGGVTGRRLVLVGLATPDEYEEPAPYLDVSLSQKLGRRWKAKFSAKNLLNPSYEVTQTWPSIGTVPIKSYKKGMQFGISMSWDF